MAATLGSDSLDEPVVLSFMIGSIAHERDCMIQVPLLVLALCLPIHSCIIGNIRTDRQTHLQTDTDTHTNRQTGRHAGRETDYRQTVSIRDLGVDSCCLHEAAGSA